MRFFAWLGLALLVVPSWVEAGTGAEATSAWQIQVMLTAQALKDEPVRPVRRHYFWSNERRHDLFFPALTARLKKGGYVGVGGDQNYTLAAAAEAKVMWLLDIDAEVVRMHRLYAALLPLADTPAAFLSFFESPDHAPIVRNQIMARYGAKDGPPVLAVYQNYRLSLGKHLRQTAELARKGQPTTWLGNLTFYRHIQGLAQKGLIIPRIGSVYGPRTLLGIGSAAEASGLTIATVYFSNAEAWFEYNQEFRRNMAALPFDEHSLVLRTLESKVLPHPSDDFWHFTVQSATDFVTKMEKPSYRTAERAMLDAKAVNPPVTGLSYIGLQ